MRLLRVNQKYALEYTTRVQHPALFMEMRLGKTLVVLRRIMMLQGIKRVLVVSPFSAFLSWINELDTERLSCQGVSHLIGEKSKRKQIFNDTIHKNRWFLLNSEGHRALPEIAQVPWDIVVWDESYKLKTHNSKVTEFYTQNFRDVLHRFILCGLPAPESELDYFAQLQFLDENILRENNFWQFKYNNFGVIEHNTYISPQGSVYLRHRLAKYCLFQKRSWFNLGKAPINEQRCVELTAKARKTYKEIAVNFIKEYGDKIIDATVFATTAYIWLRKLCGGFIQREDGEHELVFDGKIKELIYLLKNPLYGQQVIIWCRFTHEILFIEEYLRKQGYRVKCIFSGVTQSKRMQIIKDFQNELLDYLVMQPECYKYGENLSCTSVMIYYTTPEGLDTREQSSARTIDVDKTNSSLIIDILVLKTVEQKILNRLSTKMSRQEMMQEIWKELVDEYS